MEGNFQAQMQPIQDCVQCRQEIREPKLYECSGCDTRLCWSCWDAGDGDCKLCRLRAHKPASALPAPILPKPWVDQCVQCHVVTVRDPSLCFWCMQPMCMTCHKAGDGSCAVCARHLAGGRLAWPLRPESTGGRPKSLRECPKCHQNVGARELRSHDCVQPCVNCKMAAAEHATQQCDRCYLVREELAKMAS